MESVQNIIASAYAEMNVSPIELSVQDIEQSLTDTLRGMFADLKVSTRDFALTDEADCILYLQADGSYELKKLPGGNADYFEPIILLVQDQSVRVTQRKYFECLTVPLNAFSQYESQEMIVCSFFGNLIGGKRRVQINKSREFISKMRWRVRFAGSAASVLFSDGEPLIPSDFMPYLKIKTFIRCVRLVRSKATDWKEWKAETLPILITEMNDWERKWEKYCNSSDEPEEQNFLPYNGFRSR